MDWNTLQQLIRIVAQLVAGFLAGQAFITTDMSTAFVSAAVSLGGIIWWAFWLRKQTGATPPAL